MGNLIGALTSAVLKSLFPESRLAKSITAEQFELLGSFLENVILIIQNKYSSKPNEQKHEEAAKQIMSAKNPFHADLKMDKETVDELIHSYVAGMKKVGKLKSGDK